MKAKVVRIDNEKREISLHISENFPVGIVEGVFSNSTFDYIDWHWHEELQYNIVLDGEITFHVGNTVLTLKSGEGLFINTSKLHMIETKTSESSYLMIYFPPRLISGGKDDYLYKTYVQPLISLSQIDYIILSNEVPEEKSLLESLKLLNTIYKSEKPYFELEMLEIVIRIWKYTLQARQQAFDYKINNDITNERIMAIFNYIEEHYGEKITLEDIAKHINLSRNECCRMFKKVMNQNLFDYLLNFRINKSIDYLLYTNDSIADIAYNTGFNSQSYYTKSFSEIKSITPSKLRSIFKDKNSTLK